MEPLILASASPRRKELLEQAGIPFIVKPSGVEEKITKEKPEEIVMELSLLKARDAAKDPESTGIVLGADTLVAIDGTVLGKPCNEADAADMLRKLQDNTHQVFTGVSVLYKSGDDQKEIVFFEKTEVTFYPMTEQEILSYVNTGEPMDKAGAYGIQGKSAVYVKAVRGDYNNVVGLPISRLYQELKKAGLLLGGTSDV